jgi:iron complex outermembrane receptor protein
MWRNNAYKRGGFMRSASKAPSSSSGMTATVRAAVALAICVSAATATRAADAVAPADDIANTGGLSEITVTATRHEESISKVPISITALTQDSIDLRGIKDFNDVARFTPGVNVDSSGTNNISIRGIASSGGAGTTGIYIDDTPIQMRALAFNPDEALPKAFDIDRVEVLRGPQGTLFGAGSEGGTVRYITTAPSLTKTSVYSRMEVSTTEGGAPSYEAGFAVGGPIIDGTLGARATVWYRRDGGFIDRIDPTTLQTVDTNVNRDETMLVRLAGLWAVNDQWSVTPSIFYQNRERHDVENYWPLYSDPGDNRFVSANPTSRGAPDKFYLPALKIEADFGSTRLISNTSYYHRQNTTGYDGTLYDLSFYQTFLGGSPLLLTGNGVNLPAGATNYRSPATVDNGQQNITEEIRLQSNDPTAKLVWTTGAFFGANRQTYLEQIHDPLLNQLTEAYVGAPYTDFFTDENGVGVPYDPRFPQDSYFLQTHSKDQQYALFGEANYNFTDQLKLTLGARYSWTKFSFDTLTGGPQLFSAPLTNSGDKKENSFTPKVGLSYQMDSDNLFYATYAKGFRPGGANNPVPQAACAADFANFGITESPPTYKSDSVNSYEIGAKNNIGNRLRIASSIYYIQWNDIQQTVVPPICEISFIANLGKAVAKGADIQADVSVTDSFTVEMSAGYTDARYTQNSVFSTAPTASQQGVVQNGDAIVGQSGQPPAPVTASVGLEYRFNLLQHQAFLRGDYEFQGRSKWLSPGQDPNSLQFDAANFTLSSTSFVSLRGGMNFSTWTVSAFVDNLTDNHVLTNYNFSIDPGTGDSRLMRDFTFRPRTIGLTATYKY